MNPTLTEILTELYQAHQTIDALRTRVAELEAQLAKETAGGLPTSAR